MGQLSPRLVELSFFVSVLVSVLGADLASLVSAEEALGFDAVVDFRESVA